MKAKKRGLGMRIFAGIFIAVIFFSRPGLAADFSVEQRGFGVLIAGEIKRGDLDRLIEFMGDYDKTHEKKLSWQDFFLDSPGGDVEEALKIGSFLSQGYSSVWLNEGTKCFSACTIIFAGGVQRVIGNGAQLGFHRMSFSRKEIDVEKTKGQIDLENKKVIDFFSKVGFPSVLITKMNETPPTDLYVVDRYWLVQHELADVIDFQPYFLDVVEKNCGTEPVMIALRRGINPLVVEGHEQNDWQQCLEGVREANRNIAAIKDQAARMKELARIKTEIAKTHWTLAGKGASEDSVEDSVYIENSTLKRQGNRVAVKVIFNDKYKGNYTSGLRNMIVDCSSGMFAFANGSSIECNGFMCDKPIGIVSQVATPFQKAPNDSSAGILVKSICQANKLGQTP